MKSVTFEYIGGEEVIRLSQMEKETHGSYSYARFNRRASVGI